MYLCHWWLDCKWFYVFFFGGGILSKCIRVKREKNASCGDDKVPERWIPSLFVRKKGNNDIPVKMLEEWILAVPLSHHKKFKSLDLMVGDFCVMSFLASPSLSCLEVL